MEARNEMKMARQIGGIKGNVNYLLDLLEGGQIGGLGPVEDINTGCLRRALLDIKQIADEQFKTLLED